MRAIDPRTVGRLDLAGALAAEAKARNSVLPPQPGLVEIATNQNERFVGWLATELRSGLPVRPQLVVNARKPRHGTRPAPIIGIPERVAYRAVVDHVLIDEPALQREPDDYLRFITGPVDYVMGKSDGPRILGMLLDDEEIRYVVKSDLAAFYQYVDHGILSRLLVSRTRDVELVQAVAEMLADLEGRSYGIPQMLAASDRLSEVYAQLLQDQLLRRGYLVWRFNDDFRIGTPSFEAALDAIEALSEEARSMGLIINEQKTISPKFVNYAMAVFGLSSIEDEIPIDEQDEVEAAVADYSEDFGDPDEAVDLLRAAVAGQGAWDLSDVDHDGASRLRRAIWSVVRARDRRAVDSIVPLSIYVPSLTPALCRYVEVIAEEDLSAVADQVDTVVSNVSLGSWQRLWFCYLLRSTELLAAHAPGSRGARIAFAQACASDPRHAAVRAEAAFALARIGEGSAAQLASSLVTEPRALASWYVLAAAAASLGSRDEKVLRGIHGSDPFFAMLLDSGDEGVHQEATNDDRRCCCHADSHGRVRVQLYAAVAHGLRPDPSFVHSPWHLRDRQLSNPGLLLPDRGRCGGVYGRSPGCLVSRGRSGLVTSSVASPRRSPAQRNAEVGLPQGVLRSPSWDLFR
jgi:hypothetical protein